MAARCGRGRCEPRSSIHFPIPDLPGCTCLELRPPGRSSRVTRRGFPDRHPTDRGDLLEIPIVAAALRDLSADRKRLDRNATAAM